MRAACLLIALVFSLVFQTRVSFFGVSPALTTAVVYYLGMRYGSLKGILFGSLTGLIEDSISGGLLGPNLLAKGFVGYSSSFISAGMFRWTPLLGMTGIFLLTIIEGVTVLLFKAIYETTPAAFYGAIPIILLRGLINSVLGIFIKPKNAD